MDSHHESKFFPGITREDRHYEAVEDNLYSSPGISSFALEYGRVSRYDRCPYRSSSNPQKLSSYRHRRSLKSHIGLKEEDREEIFMKLNELKSEIWKAVRFGSYRAPDVHSYSFDTDRFYDPSHHHLLHPMRSSRGKVPDPHVNDVPFQAPLEAPNNMVNSSFYDHADPLAVRLSKRFPSKVSSKLCLPIGSGAPFIICCNCSMLLKLPPMLRRKQNVKQSIFCGSCSVIMSVKFDEGRVIASLRKGKSSDKPEGHDGSERNLVSSKAKQTTSVAISKSASAADSTASKGMDRPVTGASRHNNFLRDLFVPSGNEIEVSFNVYVKTNTSLPPDPVHVIEEGDRGKASKPRRAKNSFFRSLIKKSIRGLSSKHGSSQENETRKISVNGHSIPTRSVKEASVLAGTILPGDYWYDVRAGFWGVMGQPCIGIVPPLIKQFDYPMPANCSSGDTGISINGRELHQKDLDVLASRGLPTTRNKSYIVEFSGRVLDEKSGEELCFLQKLAPNVQRTNLGFGMGAPVRYTDSEGLNFSFQCT